MNRLKKLPFKKPVKSLEVYKYLSEANLAIGELKGVFDMIKYPQIILKLISMGEAINSAAIEDIETNIEHSFKNNIVKSLITNESQAITNYMRATNIAFNDCVSNRKIEVSSLNRIQKLIEPDKTGIRKIPGSKIYNKVSKEVIYVPPKNENAINDFYYNLEDYINHDLDHYDPLIRMAIIHFQFECIHPYIDGNGRVGRILNSIYLVHMKRISYPILNLSKYLRETRNQYFDLLYKCHNDITNLEEFVIYILKGIRDTTNYTINLIHQINRLIRQTNREMQKKLPAIYNEQIVIHLYKFIYTKNELFRTDLNLSRNTATKYLKELEKMGFLESEKVGKEVIYKNIQIQNIF